MAAPPGIKMGCHRQCQRFAPGAWSPRIASVSFPRSYAEQTRTKCRRAPDAGHRRV